MQKIMIIEDEADIREELALLLENNGYRAVTVTVFSEIAQQVRQSMPELILLDLGLPGRDGFSLCADIRKVSSVPIIFVTGRDSAMDELKALSLGGDDYVTKPYNILVLLARIKAALRRGGSQQADTIEVGGLTLNMVKGCAAHGNKIAQLTRNEIRILACLMERAGEIVSRADLIDYLWDSQIYIDDNTLSVNITRLRGKLDELGFTGYIRTRRGLGYQI